jgi:prevent-host-death family protein
MIHNRQKAAVCKTRSGRCHNLVQYQVLKQVSIHEAKTQLSRLLRRVTAGEEITIANRGVPVTRLIPVSTREPIRKLGIYRGALEIPDDFDAPVPDEILDLFEGKQPKKRKRS